jgi:predicted nucleic acid-binding protein
VILADTSVWIDHLRASNAMFSRLLIEGQILVHPFVIGELALGNLKDRRKFLQELSDQPHAQKALDTDVLVLIEQNHLFGKGVGFIDAHLLASARICNAQIWTTDKRFHEVAVNLGLAHAY